MSVKNKVVHEENVIVAVRMRPPNAREDGSAKGSERVIRMETLAQGSKTTIVNPETKEENTFKYDFSFQSVDKDASDYATQESIFKLLGKPILDCIENGVNACLFAYGQTGSGKSYSMLGPPNDPGLIPRICEALFHLAKQSSNGQTSYNISMQVIEIYREKIHNLLVERAKWPEQGIKETFTTDGYIVETEPWICDSYEDVKAAIALADSNRSLGAHALNQTSSRAHTIYTILFNKTERGAAGPLTTTTRLNLIDLAGSERTDVAQTSGQMFAEGCAINKSLTSLGNCIKALSQRKEPNYRESKLTLLLKQSMTNGKVVMIAAVSPAAINYLESKSTLRFAERVKTVRTKVNKQLTGDALAALEDEKRQMEAQMQATIAALRDQLSKGAKGANMDDLEILLREQEELKNSIAAKLKAMKEDPDAQIRARINKKLAQNAALSSMFGSQDRSLPHFTNLNEDARLNETLVYAFKPGSTSIGKASAAGTPDVVFDGMGIEEDHAQIKNEGGKVMLYPGSRGRTYVNGTLIQNPTELKHNARVWMGHNYVFRFVHPGHEQESPDREVVPTFDLAQREMVYDPQSSTSLDTLDPRIRDLLQRALRDCIQANAAMIQMNKPLCFEPRLYRDHYTYEKSVLIRGVRKDPREGLRDDDSPNAIDMVFPADDFGAMVSDITVMMENWRREHRHDPAAEPPPFVAFFDPQPMLIGEADLLLQPLSHLSDYQCDPVIISRLAFPMGRLLVGITPLDAQGFPGPWDDCLERDPFVEDPSELVNRDILFEVRVNAAVLDFRYCVAAEGRGCRFSKLFVRYRLRYNDEDEPWTVTQEVIENTFHPKFAFRKLHKFRVDTKGLVHLTGGKIVFQLFGTPAAGAVQAAASPSGGKEAELARVQALIQLKRKELEKAKEDLERRRKDLLVRR